MLKHYYINRRAQLTGEREVHAEDCVYLPDIMNREYLGMFESPQKAVEEARKYYFNVDGCYFCCYPAHTR